MPSFDLVQLRIGTAVPLGETGARSAIDKQPVSGPLLADTLGLAGDEQGDRKNHGGPDKAIHAYPLSNLPLWASEHPERADRFHPGAFGENFVVDGLAEADICLGDRWQVGAVLLEVSQGRQPCWKLNIRFDIADMAWQVQQTGRSGWYFRVLQPGLVAAGMRGTLVARPQPEWSLARVSHLLYHDRLNHDALQGLAALPGLPSNWRRLAERRLSSGATEDWTRRLTGRKSDNG